MKQFTSVYDVANIDELLKTALEIKANPFAQQEVGKNKTVGLIFFNPSLRTRLSSIKAAYNLGANAWVLNAGADSWTLEMADGAVMNGDSQEHIKEAIQVMSAYCDVLGVRTFPKLVDRDEDYNEIMFNKVKELSSVPVVSLESATLHPLQSFADLITIAEKTGYTPGTQSAKKVKVVMTWAPHPRRLPQAVPNSFAQWFSKVDWVDFTIVQPKGLELDPKFTEGATIAYDQDEALKDADFVYAKNWSSYENYGQANGGDKDWEITMDKMSLTNNGKFMHCLPVRRNVVVSDEVLDSDHSIVIDEATNRIYSAQTVFHEILKNN
ncbi:N-acetylornithine carbamoyltransferase [Empedobacter stercoris]|mgnify:CR=1 FL=1|uniref:N-succinylornithine carbamoyltransferase n=1 Tax=Empedobacter falsenii TaxID=343874 RepID=A0ABY8V6P7_9FLAO|nr:MULTISPECIES: N-acetylornithine carbamoyltransferase [Empedobacter]MCA4776622.1 N-acetylornithine carbamoyltransferase [Empedobacter stercoris]MCA4781265.1 N-acetylornithine carbamoyltransferase [Empedobacter stercoris]MCA4809766.1 N-acetylornithine carbamoyltransferase [Empedobacter stercoris]MDM1524132.1 N-acetylornithine carbamoyltransferase [Empedobacter sp. 225-1]MDM1544075.1 N-acetylornithine carbamoyltransferase [Empedobacter sp. 189-2]